ncbi:hypothetical protein [Methylobacterium ajmalii]|jgi:hypothetical protein|uniref:hypothetical protein n=1 Tax=Methylobacterium ajmalii TaxID=2738439 RepID=UPI00190E16E6|nr:hypothetical protein [Methylobacterium ajmalii]MBK3399080.1 hypothetical protein [Methylobacterium ajmalii]MBK3412285.1 hypothetical protein [Methylobacterium ajmalii]MBK3426800.1 hypothetical protein [Methylobacterium ajmalii]
MPTALPTSEPRLSPRETARFLWLCIRVRYLRRRMERASKRAARVGFERAGGRFVHFARLWLDCHEEAAGLLRCEVPLDVAEVRRLFDRTLRKR